MDLWHNPGRVESFSLNQTTSPEWILTRVVKCSHMPPAYKKGGRWLTCQKVSSIVSVLVKGIIGGRFFLILTEIQGQRALYAVQIVNLALDQIYCIYWAI